MNVAKYSEAEQHCIYIYMKTVCLQQKAPMNYDFVYFQFENPVIVLNIYGIYI